MTLGDDAIAYWKYHRKRFEWTAVLIVGLATNLDRAGTPVRRILDVGPAHQTLLLEGLFPDAQIDILRVFGAHYAPKRQSVHIPFDLNDAFDREKWPSHDEQGYDLIILLEVIEHLYTSPQLIFMYLAEHHGKTAMIDVILFPSHYSNTSAVTSR